MLNGKDRVFEDTLVNPLLLDDQSGNGNAVGKLDVNTSVQDNNDSNNTEGNVRLADALKFPHAFWVLVISCVVVYGCVLPFNNIASSLLLERDYFKPQSDTCHLEYPGDRWPSHPRHTVTPSHPRHCAQYGSSELTFFYAYTFMCLCNWCVLLFS